MHSQAYWINYFNSGRYFNSGCDVKLSLKFILNHYWNNYFNSGRYFISGCDVKLSLKFTLNHYWNNYFNSDRYFNSGCNKASSDNWVSCNQTFGCLRLYGDSWVSRAQPRINAYEILLQHDWLLFILDIIGSQKHIATYNFHVGTLTDETILTLD